MVGLRRALDCLFIVGAALAWPAGAQTVPLHGASQLRFATAAESRLRLGARDEFVATMGAYDRSARTGRRGAVAEGELLEFAAAQALDWQPAEIARLTLSIARISEQMRPLKLPLPKDVWLVKTTGREEADTPYTRGNAIILTQQYLSVATEEIERVITHELFHVISRHAVERRNDLYAIVGFRDCGPLAWPAELEPRRITNPDAPDNRYCITLQRAGSPLTFYPVLFAKEAAFDPALPGTFIDRLVFQLLAVMWDHCCPVKMRIDSVGCWCCAVQKCSRCPQRLAGWASSRTG